MVIQMKDEDGDKSGGGMAGGFELVGEMKRFVDKFSSPLTVVGRT